jgi:aminopeptidase N
LLGAWRASPERRILAVEEAILADALGDRGAGNVFIGAFEGKTLGRFLLSVEPRATEQVAMGAFEPFDLTDKERKKIGRIVHREQRRGRLLGVTEDSLGSWDAWLSMPLERDGEKAEGQSSFEPTHYEIEATVASAGDAIEGRTRVRLRANGDGSRVATFEILGDLLVSAAFEGDGTPAPFLQSEGRVSVVLASAPNAGDTVEVELRYAGQAFDGIAVSGARSFHLRDTLLWYPHAGEEDLATYDVVLRWPKKWELLALGELTDQGVEGDLRWQRRRVDRPTMGYTFQFGQFETFSGRAGDVEIEVAIDAASRPALSGPALLGAVIDAVTWLSGVFGPLPAHELVVVTTQMDFSQSMLGFVTLASEMTRDDIVHLALGAPDPRTTIAHEISHQWWGHQVAWRSYRDQWLSEALADYSAAFYAREHLSERAAIWNGPLSDWKSYLGATAITGQTIESLGPVVLGERLDSSLSESAYQAIVYTKGALVLNVLAQRIGEQRFHQVLRWLAERASGRSVSTADFLGIVADATKLDLRPFADAFVYGTGVPDIEYSFRASNAAGAGAERKWRMTVDAVRTAPFRFSYRVGLRPNGAADVLRDVLTTAPPANPPALVVPFEVTLRGSPTPAAGARKRGNDAAARTDLGRGALLLEGVQSSVSIELPGEPERLALDADEILLANFIDTTEASKPVLLRRGYQALASDAAAAPARFRDVLAAELPERSDQADLDAEIERAAGEIAHVTAQLELARLALDSGADDEAAASIAAATSALKRMDAALRSSLDVEVLLVESRLDLRRGGARSVARRLTKAWDNDALDTAEGLLLLAIAARETGDEKLAAEALEVARERRAEVGDLGALLESKGPAAHQLIERLPAIGVGASDVGAELASARRGSRQAAPLRTLVQPANRVRSTLRSPASP